MERFRYHASAVGFSGHIREPFNEIIPIQASVALPPTGGFGHSCVERFHFHHIFSVESITSLVAGSFSERDQTFDSLATTTLEGFNALGVVTADRIVSRIAVSHPKGGGRPSITPIGSHFDNLRIAGRSVEVDLATDTFHRLDTAPKVREAYSNDRQGFRKEFEGLALMGKGDQIPPRLQPHFPWSRTQDWEKLPESNGEINCGLVREIRGLGSDLSCHGHAIHIHGFGVIRLAEFSITDFSRTLTMIQLDLGSTPTGSSSGGTSGGNGSTGPGGSTEPTV